MSFEFAEVEYQGLPDAGELAEDIDEVRPHVVSAYISNPDLLRPEDELEEMPIDYNTFSYESHDDIGGDIFNEGFVEGDENVVGLSDLSWIDSVDADGRPVPVNPVDQGIAELEDAWSRDVHTTGTQLLPAVDRDFASYNRELEAPTSVPTGPPAHKVADVLRTASRRAVVGARYEDIAAFLGERVGPHDPRVRAVLAQVKDDAGLVGRVFIRAASFPGCSTGQWREAVRKHAGLAKYIVQKPECSGCVQLKSGSCAVFKKQVVASVPWAEALPKYAPFLRATGRTVQASGNPKEILRAAFAQAPRATLNGSDARPTFVHDADRISSERASALLREAPAQVVTVGLTWDQVHSHLDKWYARGNLTASDVERLKSSFASPEDVRRAAIGLITATRSGSYSGWVNAATSGGGRVASREEVLAVLKKSEQRLAQASASIVQEKSRREFAASREGRRIADIERRAALVVAKVDRGLRGRALVAHVERVFSPEDRGLAASILDPVFRAKNALEEPKKEVRQFSGHVVSTTGVPDIPGDVAWAQLRAASPPDPIDVSNRQVLAAQRRVAQTLDRWLKDGLITKVDRDRLASSDAEPSEVLRLGASLIHRVKVSAYSGGAEVPEGPAVSSEEVWAELERAEAFAKRASALVQDEIARRAHESTRQGQAEKKAQAQAESVRRAVSRWVSGGLLSRDDAARVLASKAPPIELLRTAASLVGKSRISSFSGYANLVDEDVSREVAWERLRQAEARSKVASQRIEAELQERRQKSIQERLAKITAEAQRGVPSTSLQRLAARLFNGEEIREVAPQLKQILTSVKTGAPIRAYQGVAYQAAPPVNTAKDGEHPVVVARLLRWARRQMSDGFVGRNLDHLIQAKFSPTVRTASAQALSEIRARHEGLSGKLYVDAEAYASDRGASGCEAGALTHRASSVPSVLQMPRCGTCVHRKVKANGTPACSVYRKPLITEPERSEELEDQRRRLIRLSDGTDAEQTAALFVNNYDPNEFKLDQSASVLDYIPEEDLASDEEVAPALFTFGGMYL